jgi:NADH-quinone oxidoreductase subunit E
MKVTSHRAGQPGDFAFTPETMAKAEAAMARYPEGRQASAILALLDLAQRQNGGWLPGEAVEYVANLLGIAPIRAHEVASVYTLFNLKPVGRHFIQVCRTTPCWLCGSDGITKACLDALGVGLGETTADGRFTVVEVECLGACATAPMAQINDDYYEDLSPERMAEIIADLAAGRPVAAGSQTGRQGSCAAGGPTSLLDSFGKDANQTIDGEGAS